MTKVAVLPVRSHRGAVAYRAVSGERQSEGKTVGEAIDRLTRQLSSDESGSMVIVMNANSDAFFTAEQRTRLGELMQKWRKARDGGHSLDAKEQSELNDLVATELRASGKRSSAMLKELRS
jgi:hypothetical protein